MSKATSYSTLRNLVLTVFFNQPTGQMGAKTQPVFIEARAEAVTNDGGIRNVRNTINIGEAVTEKLTNEELYKIVFGLSPVLAKALEGVLLDGIEEDMGVVDTSKVKPVGLADITAKPMVVK